MEIGNQFYMAQTSSNYNIYLSNDGNGNFTPSVIRNPGTVASGGTAVTIPHTENNDNGAGNPGTTLLPGVAIQAGLRAVVNDIAAGN